MELIKGGDFSSRHAKWHKKVPKFKRDEIRGRAKNSKDHVCRQREIKFSEVPFILSYMDKSLAVLDAIDVVDKTFN